LHSSGAPLWRIYFVEDDAAAPKIIETVLCGIVSWQIAGGRKIARQGWDRIDQALIPKVRENLRF